MTTETLCCKMARKGDDGMSQEFVQSGFFQLLQQFRRIRWGAELREMTQGEFVAMSAIAAQMRREPDKPGIYVSELAAELMISVSMASKLLRTLEEHGWILRTVDPGSRRNTFVSLTASGQALLEEETRRNVAVNQRVMDKMGREELARFMADARRLAECYAEELGTN